MEKRQQFDAATRCPQCGQPPVAVVYSQRLRCSRSIYEIDRNQGKIVMHDDDDEAEVLSEDEHAYRCRYGHTWPADEQDLEW